MNQAGKPQSDTSHTLEEMVIVGVVVGAHGLDGEIKVKALTDNEARFTPNKKLIIRDTTLEILRSRHHKGLVLIKIKGLDDFHFADELAGSNIEVPTNDIPDLPEGFFYHFQILGLDVVNSDGDSIGPVIDILNTGSNDVYVVAHCGKELLIPAIATVVLNVNIDTHRMTVDLPNGLL